MTEPCPLCGGEAEIAIRRFNTIWCVNPSCSLYHKAIVRENWQSRPLEDAAFNKGAEAVIEGVLNSLTYIRDEKIVVTIAEGVKRG